MLKVIWYAGHVHSSLEGIFTVLLNLANKYPKKSQIMHIMHFHATSSSYIIFIIIFIMPIESDWCSLWEPWRSWSFGHFGHCKSIRQTKHWPSGSLGSWPHVTQTKSQDEPRTIVLQCFSWFSLTSLIFLTKILNKLLIVLVWCHWIVLDAIYLSFICSYLFDIVWCLSLGKQTLAHTITYTHANYQQAHKPRNIKKPNTF